MAQDGDGPRPTFVTDPSAISTSEDDQLLGYGISLKNGVPEERYEYLTTISIESLPANSGQNNVTAASTGARESTEGSDHDGAAQIHSRMDEWAQKQSEGTRSTDEAPGGRAQQQSVSFNHRGTMQIGKEIETDHVKPFNGLPINPVGYIQNWTDIWEQAEETGTQGNPGEDVQFIVEQAIKQYPGIAYRESNDSHSGWYNTRTKQTIDWSVSTIPNPDLKVHRPKGTKPGVSIDDSWTLGVQADSDGATAGASVSIDIDVGKIAREDLTDPADDIVGLEWTYPRDLLGSTARSEKVDLELGSRVGLDYKPQLNQTQGLCNSLFTAEFEYKGTNSAGYPRTYTESFDIHHPLWVFLIDDPNDYGENDGWNWLPIQNS